jgi:catechol 2,3-dioxygenase-like lactoylglutathione lyase family enzyme
MVEVVGVDHLVVSVGDFEKSKKFYAPLMEFLGFGVEAEYESMMGWANGKTLFWIAAADEEGKKHKYRKGDIGFHHYAFRLRNRKDVDALQAYLEENGATIVDPAGEYYDDYYAVFFLDPDGVKLEGMRWGERHEQAAKKRAAKKRSAAAKKRTPSARKKRGVPLTRARAGQAAARCELPRFSAARLPFPLQETASRVRGQRRH